MNREELADLATLNADLAYNRLLGEGYDVEIKAYRDDGAMVGDDHIGARTYVIVTLYGTKYSTQFHEHRPFGTGFNSTSGVDAVMRQAVVARLEEISGSKGMFS